MSIHHISIYKNSELKSLKNMKCLDEISSNCPKDLLGPNVYKCIMIVDNITMD